MADRQPPRLPELPLLLVGVRLFLLVHPLLLLVDLDLLLRLVEHLLFRWAVDREVGRRRKAADRRPLNELSWPICSEEGEGDPRPPSRRQPQPLEEGTAQTMMVLVSRWVGYSLEGCPSSRPVSRPSPPLSPLSGSYDTLG